MNIFEALKSAFKQLMGNKARTFLTMMGMFIGIGSVIMILALGNGLTNNMLGSFVIEIKEESVESYITQEDLELLRDMEEVEYLVAMNNAEGTLNNKKGDTFKCYTVGAQPQFITSVSKKDLLYGRFLNDKDEQGKASRIIIADTVAKAIFTDTENLEEVIGETLDITVNQQPLTYEIVGIYDAHEASNLSQKELEETISYYDIYMPFTTLNQLLNLDGKIEKLAGMTYDDYDQVSVTTKMGQILNKRHHLTDGYSVQTMVAMMEMAEEMMGIITLFISAIASISLVVGGVGIMNIMLVTVKERTKEIGIRKALGAPNKVILGQFLIEALMLTFIAGILGMIIGYVGAFLLGSMINIQASFTMGMVLFSTLTSITIGVVFGVYPAYQAAKLDPVEALRVD